jgi:hypothetical protein
MRTQELLADINETFLEMEWALSSFDQGQINIVPFEGSWTAAQVGRHLIMAHSGFIEILNGPVAKTHRPSDALKKQIKTDFLDFETKTTSPDFVTPANKDYEKEVLVSALEVIRGKLNYDIESLDLSKTCMAFEFSYYGYLTRLEAVYFVLYHTNRHIHQLKNIYQKLGKTEYHGAEK